MDKPTNQELEILKSKFNFLIDNSKILAIILYGSYARGNQHLQSDIDICIVAPNAKKFPIYKQIMEGFPEDLTKYDIRFFEELPLLLRWKIIDQGIVLYSPDLSELSEYFFFSTRKELEEYQFRIKYTI